MNRLYSSHIKLISLKLAKNVSFVVFSIFIFETLFSPMPTLAKFDDPELKLAPKIEQIQNFLPENIDKEYIVKYSKYTTITAYTSEPGQTDDSPCITANGFNVCDRNIEDTIAVNFLKFGTKVRIPNLFGDKIFIVRDRMNSRFTNRVDIWMIEKDDALKLGKRLAKIEVLE